MRVRASAILWLAVSVTCALPLQAQTSGAAVSARDFVRKFYRWYVPEALKQRRQPASDLALQHRSQAFSPELLRALMKDSEAQSRVKGVIVGLDFDPFLNTQDPCEAYELGDITQQGNDYWVEVYSICSGKKAEHPDVICGVQGINGHWMFANFFYKNNGTDLLSTLKLLRQERQKSSR